MEVGISSLTWHYSFNISAAVAASTRRMTMSTYSVPDGRGGQQDKHIPRNPLLP
jgi:hypothetical protein